ncbi:molybdopterin-dependent oxidoreductase [Chromobacterium sp. IIBBL 290-4]|uniref:molybdopterin-dependent oxidoreductase n=1 Tax=Chromobacterium sp. IIBBL 290-4 TaxID=2953890 RepID=UPI0020B77F66|nr:molybdopterin-dependent oxidoreductase [Chromobacterium sp. IIBBL 290-4]UTH76232.1 molybdopterin-dependent oxidoreductase [Chromobacterium sp. IIBBL 290-4]
MIWLVLALFWMGQVQAQDLLVVTGKIGASNDPNGNTYHFSEQALLRLPQYTIKTRTTWTPTSAFTGPRLADVLNAVKAKGHKVDVVTYDEFRVSIPLSDLDRYRPVLAHTVDGKRLKRSDFGPLWLMYPVSDFPELQQVRSDAKLAWQIKALVVY